jgi:hypothetical protein
MKEFRYKVMPVRPMATPGTYAWASTLQQAYQQKMLLEALTAEAWHICMQNIEMN